MTLFYDALQDAFLDTVKLIPFLFLTYLLMEYLEHHSSAKITRRLASMGKAGPVFGGIFGVVPQCGFSASAASLYSGGVITIGTMLAVFLSTSDEMLPIFISEQVPVEKMLAVLGTKALMGIVSGLAVDAFFRRTKYRAKAEKKHIHDLCIESHPDYEDDHEGSIFRAALIHTLQILFFIFLITLLLTLAVEGIGQDRLADVLTSRPVTGVLIAGIIGLIPNCAASVTLTQLYLTGLLTAGQMMAGLLVGAGVGLLVLFRSNHHHMRENLKITALLYVIGVFWGLLMEILQISF